MGRKIGDTPDDFTLNDYQSNSITLSGYSGKVILLTFIDVKNGWEWLQKLCDVKSALVNLQSQFQIITVVYNHLDAGTETINSIPFSGPISALWIDQKLQDQGPACVDFPLIVNDAWSGSTAHSYDGGFSSLYDSNFHGNTGGEFFAYIISKDHKITDKWSKNCNANSDPISFNNLGNNVAIINPTGTFGSGAISIDISDITDLTGKTVLTYNDTPPSYTPDFSGPRIKSVIPADGSTGISESIALSVSFTGSLTKTEVEDNTNYDLSGAGATASIASGDVVYEEFPDFLSTDPDNTIFYLKQRLLQLCYDPAVLYADPETHSTVNAIPSVDIVYSKPIGHAGASYAVAGAGITSPTTNPVYTGVDAIENRASLGLGGTLNSTGQVDITVGGITDTEGNSLAGYNKVHYHVDIVGPSISSGTVAADNTYVTVGFNQPVYGSDGTGGVTQSAFSISFSQNGGHVTAASISSVKNTSGGNLTGGETSVRVNITLTNGPASGDETVNISIANASLCCDSLGNQAVSATSTGNLALNDMLASVSDVNSDKDNGTYGESEVIDIKVVFDRSVTVTGSPRLKLETGATDRYAGYNSGSGSETLVFRYTVNTGDTSDDLDYTGTDALELNGGTIKDGAGNNADLTLPSPGATHSLSKNKDIVIDTTGGGPLPGKRHIVLAMDYSGSMGWDVTIGGVTAPKVDFMEPAIKQFIDEWALFDSTDEDDRCGLVYYKTNAGVVGTGLMPIKNNADAIKNLVDPLAPSSATAMGAGLAHAYNLLDHTKNDSDYGPKRYIILFADGQLNVAPYIDMNDPTTPTSFTIDTDSHSNCPGGMGVISIPLANCTVPIYSIGIGENESWYTRLAHLAGITGGTDYATPATQIWPLAASHFEDDLVDIYTGSSPQVVFRKTGTLEKDKNVERLALNRSVTQAIVSVSWLGDEPVSFMLMKNGKTISVLNPHDFVKEDNYSLISIHFPHFQINKLAVRPKKLSKSRRRELSSINIPAKYLESVEYLELENALIPPDVIYSVSGEQIQPEGIWEVVIKRENPENNKKISYNVSVMSEEKALRYSIGCPCRALTVGDETIFSIRLRSLNHPVTKVSVVQATVTRPRHVIDELFKKYNIKDVHSDRISGIEAAPFELKMMELYKIPDALKDLNDTVVKTVKLVPFWLNEEVVGGWAKGKEAKPEEGFYIGRYSDTKVPGIYRVVFTMKGFAKECGTFERVVSRTFIVKDKRVKARSSKSRGRVKKKR
jgi:hypothetical protein